MSYDQKPSIKSCLGFSKKTELFPEITYGDSTTWKIDTVIGNHIRPLDKPGIAFITPGQIMWSGYRFMTWDFKMVDPNHKRNGFWKEEHEHVYCGIMELAKVRKPSRQEVDEILKKCEKQGIEVVSPHPKFRSIVLTSFNKFTTKISEGEISDFIILPTYGIINKEGCLKYPNAISGYFILDVKEERNILDIKSYIDSGTFDNGDKKHIPKLFAMTMRKWEPRWESQAKSGEAKASKYQKLVEIYKEKMNPYKELKFDIEMIEYSNSEEEQVETEELEIELEEED